MEPAAAGPALPGPDPAALQQLGVECLSGHQACESGLLDSLGQASSTQGQALAQAQTQLHGLTEAQLKTTAKFVAIEGQLAGHDSLLAGHASQLQCHRSELCSLRQQVETELGRRQTGVLLPPPAAGAAAPAAEAGPSQRKRARAEGPAATEPSAAAAAEYGSAEEQRGEGSGRGSMHLGELATTAAGAGGAS